MLNLKRYFLDTYSTEFRRDKHEDFFWVQMLMTIACSLLNSLWLLKDIFVKGIGPEGNLYFVILCRLTPSVLLIPFILWSFSNKKIEPYFANFLLYINLFAQIFAIHELSDFHARVCLSIWGSSDFSSDFISIFDVCKFSSCFRTLYNV